MQTTGILYLASASATRRHLLEIAQIPFEIISQSADERACNWNQHPDEVVRSIARLKMTHALIPPAAEGQHCFVLTADTLCIDNTGNIHGKPVDFDDAKKMIKLWRSGCSVITAFCLDKKVRTNGAWISQENAEHTVTSSLIFSIPDDWIDHYLRQTTINPLSIAGAMAIEEYGAQFVKSIEGSYSSILGLPLYELREALTTMGFFSAFPAS